MTAGNSPEMLDAVIIGGGPVGLFLGCCLAARGLRFAVLEQGLAPRPHSRSIGIHPPLLERFAALGMAGELLAQGVRVPRGAVFVGGKWLGELGFEGVSKDFGFILLLPQHRTEAILEARLHQLQPGALRRGARVVKVRDTGRGVEVTCEREGGRETLAARFAVGADGKRGFARSAAGISYKGGPYPDSYLMGDFADTTAYGPTAVIHLTPGGVVESFPLPGGLRRWVVRTDQLEQGATPQALCELIRARTKLRVVADSCAMLSAFGVERHLAARFVKGHTVLIGDAAHEVSPIGGQGMNLGWLDAAALAEVLEKVVRGEVAARLALRAFERRRRASARIAARQAEFNMAFGRPWRSSRAQAVFTRALLSAPPRFVLARLFTMRWL